MERDLILESLIEYVEESENNKMPITLSVNGMLVTGQMIGFIEYIEDLGKSKEDIAKDLEDFPPEDSPPKDKGRHFIHLKNAEFFIPGHIPIKDSYGSKRTGIYWRGKLSKISGFNFGKIGIIGENK